MNHSNSSCLIRSAALAATILAFGVLAAAPAVAQTASSQFSQRGENRPGSDLRHIDFPAPPPNSFSTQSTLCQAACAKDASCQSWTLVNPGIQGPNARCWIKGRIPEPKADVCCTSGVVTKKLELETDRAGMDFQKIELPQPKFSACQGACEGDRKCQAWTYVKPGVQVSNARCYLKNAIPAARTNNCCISGVVDRGPIVH